MLNKPIFEKWYSSKKPPSLQIKILKLITLQGELSKTKASKDLDSNYPDVSDAMDALAAKDNQFIKLSRETGRRRPEKFYKVTENGLRALLAINISSKEDIAIAYMVFSRIMLLLSICSKQPISDEELNDYYKKFEKERLGHSTIYGFFLSNFFEIVLDNWIQNLSEGLAAQKVIECLAINRSITRDELIKKTGLKEDEIIAVLHNHTIFYLDLPAINSTSQVSSNIDVNKYYYINFISHALITKAGDVYELSLFGIMLIISLIRYHYMGIDTDWTRNSTTTKIDLFNNDVKSNEYCDLIAKNYNNKLRLIFGKWNLLQNQLGRILYASFDFLIYKKGSKTTADSVWIGGNKEFYDDIQALASNARNYLLPLYSIGKSTMDRFQTSLDIMQPRLIPLRKKLYEIEVMRDRDIHSFANEPESQRLDRLKVIEDIFVEELTFLFYLNLNTIAFSGKMGYYNELRGRTRPSEREINQWILEQNQIFKEMSELGYSPRDRLMAILAKDNDIKQWFAERMSEIMHYRKQTFNAMSVFYNKILDPSKYIKKEHSEQKMAEQSKIEVKRYAEEFDINKICTY